MKRLLIAAGLFLALAACNDQFASSGKSMTPVPPRTVALMAEKGMQRSDPILVRLYKKESELEVWKKTQAGEYALLKSFPICRWSGQLGPKQREGDRQAPEGFYTITPAQMNPNSAYYLSFDTGYPNAFDRDKGRTGSQLMVHGTCSSRGCYAMTDDGIAEVYALAREAFAGGQKGFQFQAYPFRMTAENLTKFRKDTNMPFWANLKEGSDHFEVTKREPKVAVCGGRYAFDTTGGGCAPDKTIAPLVAEKEAQDRQAVAELVAKGVPAVKVVYADGGGHDSFREAAMTTTAASDQRFGGFDAPRRNLGDVSRPDALAEGPREIAIEEAKSATLLAAVSRKGAPATRLAATSAAQPSPAAKTGPAAKAGRTVLASADPDEPVLVAAAAPPEKPFYDRMVGGLLGGEAKAPAPAPVPVAVEATRPAPPAKAAAASPAAAHKRPTDAKAAAAHGAKANPAPAKTSGLIPGSAPIGPMASAFKPN
jgi:murein L,D-transpeptidase YafK